MLIPVLGSVSKFLQVLCSGDCFATNFTIWVNTHFIGKQLQKSIKNAGINGALMPENHWK